MPDRLALATTTPSAPMVTPEHLALVKNTIAKDATPAELELFLYDCARQGVHPLDRLIHFTVRTDRNGKRTYTPIASIDLMRIRAAESGECIGIDDAAFLGTPMTASFEARVTVYRLVQGQRAPFTATARWTEYKPDQDFMWKKLPHVMLGKCAEAAALRKGFPKQLSGLYVKEEMEQAERPLHKSLTPSPGPALGESSAPDGGAGAGAPVVPANLNDAIPAAWKPFVDKEQISGVIVAIGSETKPALRSGTPVTMTTVTLDTGESASTLRPEIAERAIALKGVSVVLITQAHKKLGREIVSITAADDVQL
jgi:phage recombination protein Bet